MNDQDMDHLLEQGLAGDSPGPAFRARVLGDSTAAFVRARQGRAWWRPAWLGAAAALVAAVSFLLGRGLTPRPPATPTIAEAPDVVAVPKELVVWLDAARLFRQLGMEDRMGRALDRAAKLLPREAITAVGAAEPAFAAGGEETDSRSEHAGSSRTPGLHQSVGSMNRVMAQSLGGYTHASEMD